MHGSLLGASPPVLRTSRTNGRYVARGIGSYSGGSSVDEFSQRSRASLDLSQNASNAVSFDSAKTNWTSTTQEGSIKDASEPAFQAFGFQTVVQNENSKGKIEHGMGKKQPGLLSLELTGRKSTNGSEGGVREKQGLSDSGMDNRVQETLRQWELQTLQGQYKVFGSPLVKLAYTIASEAHAGQYRKNGEPVLVHCIETAKILAEMNADETTVAAGLLHDALDDTVLSYSTLRSQICPEVCELVKKVSQISYISQLVRDHETNLEKADFARLRDMFTAVNDARAVLVKLADRMHNLRTVSVLPLEKQLRVAKESLKVFAPLAGRLGCWGLKCEMEDSCFAVLHPTEYKNLRAHYDEFINEQRSSHLEKALLDLKKALDKSGTGYVDISGRPKNLYGVYKKMRKKGLTSLTDVLDLLAVRVVVQDKASCYKVLREVHSLWKQVGGVDRSKDYIRNPKKNGYQSLHEVLVTREGVPLEVQIRTTKMHYIAEHGIAAHWRYKEDDEQDVSDFVAARILWSRYVLGWVLELNDKKSRPMGLTHDTTDVLAGLGSTFCTFPDREDGFQQCKHHASFCPRPVSNSEFWSPIYVAIKTKGELEVCEVTPDCTMEQFLLDHMDGLGASAVFPTVNGGQIDPDYVLKFGDLIEFRGEAVEQDEGMDMFSLAASSQLKLNGQNGQDMSGTGSITAFVQN